MSLFADLTREQELLIVCLISGKRRNNSHIAAMMGVSPDEVKELIYRIKQKLHKVESETITNLYHKSVAIEAYKRRKQRQGKG